MAAEVAPDLVPIFSAFLAASSIIWSLHGIMIWRTFDNAQREQRLATRLVWQTCVGAIAIVCPLVGLAGIVLGLGPINLHRLFLAGFLALLAFIVMVVRLYLNLLAMAATTPDPE